MTTKTKKCVGYNQLQSIISEIMDMQTYPNWDFINNVLSCKNIFGENTLWFWIGELYIVRPGQKTAGEMEILDDWNTELDGTFTFIGKNS